MDSHHIKCSFLGALFNVIAQFQVQPENHWAFLCPLHGKLWLMEERSQAEQLRLLTCWVMDICA